MRKAEKTVAGDGNWRGNQVVSGRRGGGRGDMAGVSFALDTCHREEGQELGSRQTRYACMASYGRDKCK